MTPAQADPNYWMARCNESRAEAQKVARVYAAIKWEDRAWVAALIFLLVLSVVAIGWRTLPGGVGMVPTFLLLQGAFTAMVWRVWLITK